MTNDRPDELDDYADVADELDGGLKLEELGKHWVEAARKAAVTHSLPWPPEPCWEDDVRGARQRIARRARQAGHTGL